MSRECKRCGENHEERDLINKAVDDHFWELFDDETEGSGETSPPKPSEPIELEDIIDDYMPSNDEQDALAKSLMKDDLLEWMKSLVLNDVIGEDEHCRSDAKSYEACHCTDLLGTCTPIEENWHREELRTKLKNITSILESEKQ